MTFIRMAPPIVLRTAVTLPGMYCRWCNDDTPSFTGRIVTIPHARPTICESCIEYADQIGVAARLARVAAKVRRKRQ